MEIACPQCGGTTTWQITPGYFRCASRIFVGVVPPELSGASSPFPHHRICGFEFHSGTPNTPPACECGRFAIGNCIDCSKAVCGLHGSGDTSLRCANCQNETSIATAIVESRIALSGARSEVLSAAEAQEREQGHRESVIQNALRVQDERTGEAVSEFLSAARDIATQEIYLNVWEPVEVPHGIFGRTKTEYRPTSGGAHMLDSRYVDECTTRKIFVMPSGHVLYSVGDRDSDRIDGVEKWGDFWRRGEECCRGEVPFQFGRRGLEVGRTVFMSDSWPVEEVLKNIETTSVWFVRLLAAYLVEHTNSKGGTDKA